MPAKASDQYGTISLRKALRPRLPQAQSRFRWYDGSVAMTLPASVAQMTPGMILKP